MMRTHGGSEMRDRIVKEALSWVGTPYHGCADIKGVGCDCGMLLLRVFSDIGLIPFKDPRPYSQEWHLHKGEELYLTWILKYAKEIDYPPSKGDVILFRLGRCYSHGAIITMADPLTIVHAYAPAGLVIEEEVKMNAALSARPIKIASYFGE